MKHLFLLSLLLLVCACATPQKLLVKYPSDLKTGADLTGDYLPLLRGRQVAVVANQTSRIGPAHLVDSLVAMGIAVKCVFAPEHGFRGEASDGAPIDDGKDVRTGIPILSIYGKHQKPTPEDLAGVQVVLFDIQDVGARFYTYISTLQYVMEACAAQGIDVVVLDRPNPHGFYVDGPLLDKKYRSFVGMNAVPAVYGMTIGEYAMMLNGEGWLEGGAHCSLKVIRMRDYDHNVLYQLPVSPSPNLPNMTAVYLYPSLCFFEGTRVSIGRGTEKPFQLIGYPGFTEGDTSFTPVSIPGKSESPLYKDTLCHGIRLEGFEEMAVKNNRKLYLHWLLAMYGQFPDKEKFFIPYFSKLAGNETLQEQVKKGWSEDDIRKSWKDDLDRFKKIRKKYLLYPDFE